MERIASFTINHLNLMPGLYVSRRDAKGDCVTTTFDLRITAPNREPVIDTPALHTIEHLAATYLRNSESKEDVIYFGPMGCRTGCYLVMFGNLDSEDIYDLVMDLCDFIIGFAKKILISNTVATISEQIMSSDYQYLGCGVAWLGAFCYMLHIYYDFSGYSEMAIGLGKMFGFHLPQNFNFPYMAGNITEFWRRWHITLSSFFRNYVYIPMGGSRKGNVYVHLIIVFLLTGIWHGANWTFIVWGMWHGLFIVIERKFKEKGHLKSNILTWTYTMLVVLVGWVMFSAESVTTGFSYLKIMFGLVKNEFTLFGIGYYMTVAKIWVVILAVIGCAPVVKNFFEKKIIYKFPNVYRGIMFLLFGIAIIELMTNSYNPFIYFQF